MILSKNQGEIVMRRDGSVLIGVGAALAILVLLVLQSLTGSGLFGTRTETVTTTVTTTQQISDVRGAFAEHMLSLGSRNVSALVSQYAGDANVTWTGQASGLAGTYIGKVTIGVLLGQFFEAYANSFTIANVTQAMAVTSSDSAAVNSTFGFTGWGERWGNTSGTVSAQDYYSYSTTNDAWLISQETWTFLSFNVQFPAG